MIGLLVASQSPTKKWTSFGGSRQMERSSTFDHDFAHIVGSAALAGSDVRTRPLRRVDPTAGLRDYPSGASSGAATTREGTNRNPEPGVSSPVVGPAS